jgi:hypothetical protein
MLAPSYSLTLRAVRMTLIALASGTDARADPGSGLPACLRSSGRTMKGLLDLAAQMADRGIGYRSLTDGIDTAGTAGKLVFNIMAAIAEMERELNWEFANARRRR